MTGYLMNQAENNTYRFIVYVCNTIIEYIFEYNILSLFKRGFLYKSFKPFSDDYGLDLFT